MTRIAVLHPGAMGAEVMRCARARGHEIRWWSAGRSAASARRAAEVGADAVADLDELVAGVEMVWSICPPDAALATAGEVAGAVRRVSRDDEGEVSAPLYLDANAIAPVTAAEVGRLVRGVGCRYVDGGIIGPPPTRAGSTRLYVAGPESGEVASVLGGSLLDVVQVSREPASVAASALKMVYAGWTKATSALVLVVAAAARGHGVDEALAAEWEVSQPELADRLRSAAAGSAPKAWRFGGEMLEVAATLAQLGLPAGFHLAANDVFKRLSDFRDRADPPPTVDEVLTVLVGGRRRVEGGGSVAQPPSE